MGETVTPANADWPSMLARPKAVNYRQDIVMLASVAFAEGAGETQTFLANLGLKSPAHLYIHQALEVTDSPAYVMRAAIHEARFFANYNGNRGQYDDYSGAF